MCIHDNISVYIYIYIYIEKKIQLHLDLIVNRLKLNYNKIQLTPDSRKNANVRKQPSKYVLII